MKTNYLKIISIAIIFFNFIYISPVTAKTIRYVKVDGTGDGLSWANASNSIQAMIDNSATDDEVWVAKGTYYPTTETIARDARSRTFVVKAGINLYGGFEGTESNIEQRKLTDLDNNGKIEPWEFANQAILSGNIDGIEDVWTKTMNTDGKTWKWTVTGNEGNCYNVVTANSKIDGFSVIGSNSNKTSSDFSGGIKSNTTVVNCIVTHCSDSGSGGGGISANEVSNCLVNNCFTIGLGGGIAASTVTNCTVKNCFAIYGGGGIYGLYISKCNVNNCSTNSNGSSNGGGISVRHSISNCIVSNCSADNNGGGIFAEARANSANYHCTVTNCTVTNCTANNNGGGIYASSDTSNGITTSSIVYNCVVNNCSSTSAGGGIYASSTSYNCAASNNKSFNTIDSGIRGRNQSCISPIYTESYIQPTSFIGVASSENQILEINAANWRLKEASPCINGGTTTQISSIILNGNDIDDNPRVNYGKIDIGAYEYSIRDISLPVVENFNNWTDFDNSEVFYRSKTINTTNDIKWTIVNQKAVFSWQNNLTTAYTQPFFTYSINATNASKVYLKYDMYYQAYAGTITPLGTEKLNIDCSLDLDTWIPIAEYSNLNGTIANNTYNHDLSSKVSGNKFFIRFNANGLNSNRIEKWEIDNVIIDGDGVSAVNSTLKDKYKYSIINNKLIISNLDIGSSIQLFDINGKLLNTKSAVSQNAQLTLLVRGVYLVKVSSDTGIENKKIVW